MASKKNRRKQSKSKHATAKKAKRSKRIAKARPNARSAKKASRKKAASRKKTRVKKVFIKPRANAERRRSGSRASAIESDLETGDLQGLSRAEEADSESVEELVEEGNIFEAGAVAGVEKADNEDEREVHTRELPEDDVPEEYLDKD